MQRHCVDQCSYLTGSTPVFGRVLIILEWYWYVANIRLIPYISPILTDENHL